MKKLLKWVKLHVRPYLAYRGTHANKGNIDFREDDIHDIKDKVEKYTEAGVKITFKF